MKISDQLEAYKAFKNNSALCNFIEIFVIGLSIKVTGRLYPLWIIVFFSIRGYLTFNEFKKELDKKDWKNGNKYISIKRNK